jgi:hypothetical protein
MLAGAATASAGIAAGERKEEAGAGYRNHKSIYPMDVVFIID